MKTCIIPDLHGRSDWKLIVHRENPDKVIFLGDYFDSFDISGVEQIHNFKEIIEYKETAFTNSGKEDQHKTHVVMLIGNHDHHYFANVGYSHTSGYQKFISHNITQVIEENRHHLQMAYKMDSFLFTHAGVSPIFMDHVFGIDGWNADNIADDLNELFKYKPLSFLFNSADYSGCGEHKAQSPIWIRPASLMSANKVTEKIPNGLKNKYIQVVGHSIQNKIDVKGNSTGSRYYFVDVLPTSGEYMIIEDGVIKFNK